MYIAVIVAGGHTKYLNELKTTFIDILQFFVFRVTMLTLSVKCFP